MRGVGWGGRRREISEVGERGGERRGREGGEGWLAGVKGLLCYRPDGGWGVGVGGVGGGGEGESVRGGGEGEGGGREGG